MKEFTEEIKTYFNKFAGMEVAVNRTSNRVARGGRVFDDVKESVDPKDETYQEMKEVAEENGFKLHVWLPHGPKPEGKDEGRLVVYLDEDYLAEKRHTFKVRRSCTVG